MDNGSTVSEINEAKEKIKTPEIKEELDKAAEEKREANKAEVDVVLHDAPVEESSDEFVPTDELPFDDVDDTILVDDEMAKSAVPMDQVEVLTEKQLQERENQAVESPVTPKSIPDVAKTVLKENEGRWVTNDDGRRVFIEERNSDGTKVPAMYTNQETGERVPVTEVFETDENNRLLVNTPNVLPGTRVRIVREPNWTYFKSDNPADVPLNIYRVIPSRIVTGKH